MKFNYKKIIISVAFMTFWLFLLGILFLSVKGTYGNPNENDLLNPSWKSNGPFELSPERGRYALLYSLFENKSFYFSVNLARFVLPDLGFKNGHYVSLFAPGVSYIAMLGYSIGRLFNTAQVGAFMTISIVGLINAYLIFKITKRLGTPLAISLISALTFLFATPAFAYAVNLYQHNISTFLILASIYLLIRWNNFFSLAIVWLLCAASIPVDYPNLFLMMPIGIFGLSRIIKIKSTKTNLTFSANLIKSLSLLSVILPLSFFLWFNKQAYDNPLQFSGTVGSVSEIANDGTPSASTKVDLENVEEFLNPDEQKRSAVGFFKARNLVNGMYIHLMSPDRGIIIFSPVVLFGIIGVLYYKKRDKESMLPVLLGVVIINLVLYSMWGDPWGGWAFGSRYMIPSYAILAIFVSFVLTRLGKKWYFIIPFWTILIYSIFVNTLGAITTIAMPPQVEVLELEKLSGKRERYSWDRNWEFINSGRSKSFVYQTWGHNYVSALQYFYIIFGAIAGLSTILIIANIFTKDSIHHDTKDRGFARESE